MKIVVTSGAPFTDIDALACAITYAELLAKEGKDACAVLPGPLNKSITSDIKTMDLYYETKFKSKNASFVLVDVSDPKYFASFVKKNKIIEIYDHRTGFEKYWKKKLGKKAKIKMVGACATLIWEEYLKRIKPITISTTCANLLYIAIISNTLNLKASITTKRDKKALEDLSKFTQPSETWLKKYFEDQDEEANNNPYDTIINDTKGGDLVIGQVELWDSRKFIKKHLAEVEKALASFGNPKWFLTSPSISEGKNYIYTKNKEIKKLLKKTIGVKFKGNLGTTKKLWLRKEILKKLQESK